MSREPQDKPEVPSMVDQTEEQPVGEVVPLEDVPAQITRLFDEAVARGRQKEAEQLAQPDPAQMMVDAWQRWIDAAEANAKLFPPEHRDLFPGPGSGTA